MPSHHTAGWRDLLTQIQQYLTLHNKPKLRGFISFAWETTPDKREFIQTWLTRLQEDLIHAGFADVFLDIKNMSGNLQETMRTGLANSQVIFFICNPRFVARLKEADKERGLGFEVQEVLAATKKPDSKLMVLPILQAGTAEESIPEELQEFVRKNRVIDLRGEHAVYQKQLTGFMAADGLLNKAYQISVKEPEYQAILRRHYLSTALPELPKLFGRATALEELATRLQSQSVQILCGESGVGKSALAMTHAKTARDAYAFVRYLRIATADDWETALGEFAQDLSVTRTELNTALLALPSWLIVIDSNNLELPWQEVFAPGALGKEQHVLLVTQVSTAPDAIRLPALAEEDAMEMVHNYLADIPAQEQQLVTKYAGFPKDLVKAIHYIQNSPWLDLTDFLTHDLTPSDLPMRAGTMQQEEVQLQVAPPKKWDVLKQDIRGLVQAKSEKIKVGMLSEEAEDALKVSLHKDLTECGMDIQSATNAEQFEEIKALVILNTPDFKDACEEQEDNILKWHMDKVPLLPLVIDGDFKEALPEFLHNDFLARPLDVTKEAAYQKMLMGLISPLGIVPAICGFAAGYKPYEHYWYNYWLSNLPDIGRFVGRTEFLTNIHTKLHERNSQSIVAITGMGGFGKTSVAIRYGEIHKADYDLVRVIDSDAPVLHSSLYSFAKDLGIEIKGKKISDVLDLLHRELANISNYLLIFDNVEQFAAIKDYLPTLTEGQHIIITSRDDHGVDWPKSIKFAEFTPAEATEYVHAELQEQNEALGQKLGYLPLALKTAVAFIKEKRTTGEYTISDYLREAQESMASNDSPVMKSLKLSLSKIAQAPDALTILRYCAFLAPEHIMPTWFKGLGDFTIAKIYNGLMILANYSMLGVKNKELMIHRLMQEAIRNSIALSSEEVLESYLLPLTETIRTTYPREKSNPGDYDLIKQLIPHIVGLQQHLQGQDGLPSGEQLKNDAARAFLLDRLGDAYGANGDFSQQCVILQESLAVKGKCYGTQHLEYVNTLRALAEAYGSLGNYPEQSQCLEEAIGIYKQCHALENRRELYRQTLADLTKVYELLGGVARDKIYAAIAAAHGDIDVSSIALSTAQKFPATREQANQLFPALFAATKGYGVNRDAYEALAKLELSPEQTSQLFSALLAARKDAHISPTKMMIYRIITKLKLSPEQTSERFLALLAAIKDEDHYVRPGVYQALDELVLSQEQNSQRFSAILAATKSRDRWGIGEDARKALAKMQLSPEQISERFATLFTATKDKDYSVRKAAYQDLTKLELSLEQTSKLFLALLAATKDENFDVRGVAYEALPELKLSPEQTSKLFLTLLATTKDKDSYVRRDAYAALTKLELSPEQTSQRFSALLEATKDEDWCLRKEACHAIAALEPSPEQASQRLSTLLAVIKDKMCDVRLAAYYVLAKLELTPEQISQQFSALLAATKDENHGVRQNAYQVLTELELSPAQTSQLFAALLAATKDENHGVRLAACAALTELALSPEQTSQLFLALLNVTKDKEWKVRLSACQALAALEFSTEQTSQLLPELFTATKDEDSQVRLSAYQALAELELSTEQTSQQFSALLAATKDEDSNVRKAAYKSLAKMELTPEQTSQQFSALLAATKDEDQYLREAAYQALTKLELSPEQASQLFAVLLAATKDKCRYRGHDIRGVAYKALTELKLSTEQTSQRFAVLLAATKDEDEEVRQAAYQALAELELSSEQTSQRFAALLAATKDKDSKVRLAACEAIAALELSPEQTSQQFSALLVATKDEDSKVRLAAYQAIAKIELSPEQTSQLLPALLTATKDEDSKVRLAAYQAIAKIELSPEQTSQLLPALLTETKDVNIYDRLAAYKVLAELNPTTEQKSQQFSALLTATEGKEGFTISSEKDRVRLAAYQALVKLELSAEQTGQLFPALLATTKDKNMKLRLTACEALTKLELSLEQKDKVCQRLLIISKTAGLVLKAVAKESLATLYGSSGECTKQLELLEQALKIKRLHFGIKHGEYAKTLTLLANYYVNIDSLDIALTYFAKALPILKKEYGIKHHLYKDCLKQQQQAQEKFTHNPCKYDAKDIVHIDGTKPSSATEPTGIIEPPLCVSNTVVSGIDTEMESSNDIKITYASIEIKDTKLKTALAASILPIDSIAQLLPPTVEKKAAAIVEQPLPISISTSRSSSVTTSIASTATSIRSLSDISVACRTPFAFFRMAQRETAREFVMAKDITKQTIKKAMHTNIVKLERIINNIITDVDKAEYINILSLWNKGLKLKIEGATAHISNEIIPHMADAESKEKYRDLRKQLYYIGPEMIYEKSAVLDKLGNIKLAITKHLSECIEFVESALEQQIITDSEKSAPEITDPQISHSVPTTAGTAIACGNPIRFLLQAQTRAASAPASRPSVFSPTIISRITIPESLVELQKLITIIITDVQNNDSISILGLWNQGLKSAIARVTACITNEIIPNVSTEDKEQYKSLRKQLFSIDPEIVNEKQAVLAKLGSIRRDITEQLSQYSVSSSNGHEPPASASLF